MFSDNFESLQNENNHLKQQLKDNQFLFETQKTEFISQIEKEKEESLQLEIEKTKIQLSDQFKNDRRESNQLVQQFQNSFDPFESHQEEISRLRFLFLNHLSFHHSFQKEERVIIYEYQTKLDNFFQSDENSFELFFS
jgi:CRISPR/Cas system CSM-associated protein Csm2 small subunit